MCKKIIPISKYTHDILSQLGFLDVRVFQLIHISMVDSQMVILQTQISPGTPSKSGKQISYFQLIRGMWGKLILNNLKSYFMYLKALNNMSFKFSV